MTGQDADSAWNTAVGAGHPYTTESSPAATRGERPGSRYLNRLSARAAADRTVDGAFRDVLPPTAAPARLLRPSVVRRTTLLPRRPGLSDPPREVDPR